MIIERTQDSRLKLLATPLLKHGWLARRPKGFQAAILASARIRSFEPKEALYNVGDVPNGLFGISAGTVVISIPSGTGSNVVALRGDTGFWIGDLAIMSDQKRLVGVHAATPVKALHVSPAEIDRILQDEPRYFREFYALSHMNMATALDMISNLSVQGSSERLGLRLLQRDSARSASGEWMNYSQEELAGMIAVSSATLQRAVRTLAGKGLIEVGYGKVRITDRDGLTKFCRN